MVDMLDLTPQYAQVVIAQAGAEKPAAPKTNRTLGVCQVFENRRHPGGKPRLSAINSVSPIDWVEIYFSQQERRKIKGPSTVTVLENPKHGELRDEGTFVMDGDTRALSDTGKRGYSYIPAPDYFGKDGAVVLVEIAGIKVRIVYSFHVAKGFVEGRLGLCPPRNVRRISLNPDDPNGGLISFQHLNNPQATK